MIKSATYLILYTTLLLTSVSAHAGDWGPIKVFTAPPEASYKEVGSLVETQEFMYVAQMGIEPAVDLLKAKAKKFGADAIILGKIELVPAIIVKKETGGMDPMDEVQLMGVLLRVEAAAIKLQKP